MNKIKRFNITVRTREVLRALKQSAAVTEITPQLQDAVETESARLARIVAPAAVYDTLPREKLTFDFGFEIPKECIALSLYAVTVGTAIENELAAAAKNEATMGRHIVRAIADETCDQSVNFIGRLLREEAKDDGCELLERQRITSPVTLRHIFDILPNAKIDIALGEDGTLMPAYSTCGVVVWIPVKKRGSKK